VKIAALIAATTFAFSRRTVANRSACCLRSPSLVPARAVEFVADAGIQPRLKRGA